MTSTTNVYKAWTRKKGSNDKYVTTEVKAKNMKEAKEKIRSLGCEIDGKIYKSNA